MEPKRPFSVLDRAATPEPVKQYVLYLERTIATLVESVQQLEKRIEHLEVRANKNSQNSSKPPSTDGPYKKPVKRTKKRKKKKGHKGHSQQILELTGTRTILPTTCDCCQYDLDSHILTSKPIYHLPVPAAGSAGES